MRQFEALTANARRSSDASPLLLAREISCEKASDCSEASSSEPEEAASGSGACDVVNSSPSRWPLCHPGAYISYGHTFSRGLKRANINTSLKNDTWSEQRDSNCQSEVQVSGSECQMVAHSDCSKMGILCAGRGAQTQILIRWIVNAETLIAIFIDHPPLLASCCGNSEA